MRTPLHVLAQIEALAPAEALQPMERAIAEFRRDIGYCAPEMMWREWGKLSDIVTEIVGPPPLVDEWRVKVVALLMDLPEEMIRSNYGPKQYPCAPMGY